MSRIIEFFWSPSQEAQEVVVDHRSQVVARLLSLSTTRNCYGVQRSKVQVKVGGVSDAQYH